MTTKAHAVTRAIAAEWDAAYPSAVFSGIAGDAEHQARGGYHISIEDQSRDNYSVVRPGDKAPPGDWPRDLAAAIDMSMSPTDMALCSSRLWNVWYDKSDPRRIYINGFNGWFNDGNPAKRYDFITLRISNTTSDHKWHVHLEIIRQWVTDTFAAKAIISVIRGETKQQYLDSIAIPDPTSGDDMFCEHGQTNGKVWVLQAQINDVLRFMGVPVEEQLELDWEYGDKTAAALVRIGIGNPENDGKVYNAGEYKALLDQLMMIAAKAHSVPGPPGKPGEPGPPGEPGEPGKTPTQVTFGPITATVTASQ